MHQQNINGVNMPGYKKTRRETLETFIHNFINISFNIFLWFSFYYEKLLFGRHKQLSKNIELKNIYIGQRCFVLGNGPSLNNQNIELLQDEVVFMVNRSFLDPRYRVIKPNYHVIIDDKLSTGEWPITYLDDIAEQNPEVVFLLNSKWFNLEIFSEYKKKYKIYWIDQRLKLTPLSANKKINLTKINYGGFVVEQGIISASYMGFKDIFITGVDGDGIANLLLNQDSHSYGVNDDDIKKASSWQGIRQSLCSVCKWLLSWHYLDKYIFGNGSKVINLTGRGIISMVSTDDFSNIKH